MAIVRLIFCAVPKASVVEAIQDWKVDCDPIMIRQKGCISEQLLHSTSDDGEFISYSEWQSQAAVDAYLASADHELIKEHTGKIKGANVTVKSFIKV